MPTLPIPQVPVLNHNQLCSRRPKDNCRSVVYQCHKCGGGGCPTCKGEGWIELLGAGMIHPRVLEMSGINPDEYSGWAFGMGLERTAMRRFKIADLRLIFENDVRFLEQF